MSYDTSQLIHEDSLLESIEDNEDVNTENSVFPQYVTALTATLPAFLSGMVLGWTSPLLDALLSGKFNNLSIDKTQMGWIGSCTVLGAMSMCIPTGFICDLIGRKRMLLFTSIPFLTGWMFILNSTSVWYLYIGRFVTGMGFGASCVAAPIYISEISGKSIRGTLGSYFQLMVTAGILFSYIFGGFMSPFNFTFLCALCPVIFVVLFVFQPESPVYLVKIGKLEQAEACLNRLNRASNELEPVFETNFRSLTKRSNIKGCFIAFSLMFFQQFCGVNAVILYSSNIFSSSGMKNVELGGIILGIVQVISTLFSSFLIDKLGRRVLMLTSSCFVAFANLSLAVFFNFEQVFNGFQWIPVVSLGVFISMFSIGLGPIPWVIGAEIFPPDVKSIACSGAGTFNMFLAFLVTKFYLNISDIIGNDSTCYIFTGFSILGVVFTYFILLETKGKSIEEIQVELDQRGILLRNQRET